MAEDKSVSELVSQVTEQSTKLARQEVALAKAEMELKARRIGIGVGAYGSSGIVALLAAGALTATFILALATAIEPWVAALIITVIYATIAGGMALVARQKVKAGTPPVPEQAVESSRQDIEQIKTRAKEGLER